MKNKNSTCSTLLEAFRDGRLGKYFSIILVFAFLNMLGGCYYYKVVTSDDPPPEVIRAQQDKGKFFILHSGDQAWKFSDIRVSNDSITGEITPLQGHEYYKTKRHKHTNKFKVSSLPENDESDVISEVHITISGYDVAEGNEISIAPENIDKIEIHDLDTGTTSASFIFGELGVLALIPVVLIASAFVIGGE